MTHRSALISVLLAAATALLIVSIGGARLRDAAARVGAAEATIAKVTLDAERTLSLRAQVQTVAAGEQPEQDTFRRVNDALAAAGLSRVRVQSVSPAGDRALDTGSVGGVSRRVQTVRIVVEPIALDELGAFLDRWRHDQALWTITGIDLATVSGRGHAGAYRATLTASAVYIADALASSTP